MTEKWYAYSRDGFFSLVNVVSFAGTPPTVDVGISTLALEW